jgi:HlyD family secretion protein
MTFTVRQGRARIQKIEIAHNNGVAAEVQSGLSAGDFVIIHPPDSVHDGAAVTTN